MKKYDVYLSYVTCCRGTYEAKSEEDAIQMCREDGTMTDQILRNLEECDNEVKLLQKEKKWTGKSLAELICTDISKARQGYLKYTFHYKNSGTIKVLKEFCNLVRNGEDIAVRAWFKLTERQRERIEECIPEYFHNHCLVVH